MNTNYMLDAKSLSASNPHVKEVSNLKSIYLSIFVCLVSFSIIFLSSWVEDKSSTSYIGGNTLAAVLLIVGFYILLNKRKKLVFSPTNSTLLKGEFYLEGKQLELIKEAVTSNLISDYSQFKLVRSGNVRLDYVVSSDGKFVAVQLFEYIPYKFEAVTELVSYENDQAHNLGMFLLKNHCKI